MVGPGVFGRRETNDEPNYRNYEDEEPNRIRGVHEDLQAGTYDNPVGCGLPE
jgi:hypothetical protein